MRSGPYDPKNDFKQPAVGKTTPLPQPKPEVEPAPPATPLKNVSWPRWLVGAGAGLASVGLALVALLGLVIDNGSRVRTPSATPTEQPSGQPVTPPALGNGAKPADATPSTTTAGAAPQPPVVVTPATPLTTVPAPAGPTTTLPRPTPTTPFEPSPT